MNYNPKDPKSIENFASLLVNRTFMDIIQEKEGMEADVVKAYANRARKGGLGNLLEEVYFGYKANSKQEADFVEAGVELKATPYEYTQKGELRAGERLVLTMIGYDQPVELEFYDSHVWEKMKSILLIYYWRNKQLESNLLYKIGYVKLFTPPEADLIIIKADYQIIINKIRAGKAHELSESDTLYLGACTKGSTAAKSTVPQYYGEKIHARKRAFCFKNSYMTFVLNHYIAGTSSSNSIIKDSTLLGQMSFEQLLESTISRYIGKTDKELCELLHREYNNNKAQWNDLVCKMLGIRDENADEFLKANIRVKTVRIEENDSIRENMSFATFKFMDLVEEEFEDSTLHNYFEETRLFFVVWKKSGDNYRLVGSKLWNMPYKDLDVIVRREWEQVRRIIETGIQFTKRVDANGKISFQNSLPNKSDTEIIHVRPHAAKAAYRFLNGEEYGDVEKDANILPNGEYMTTQSFWLNNDYVRKQLGGILKNNVDQKSDS